MPRKRRVFTDLYPYHVGNHLVDDLTFSTEEMDMCLSLLEETIDKFDLNLISYNIMPNHYHFIIKTNKITLDKAMHSFDLKFSKRFNFLRGRKGHTWRHRYFATLITTEEQLLVCMRYVDRNALAAGFVSDPIKWKWSSYKFYVNAKNNYIFYPPTYIALGVNDQQRFSIYEKLVMTPIPSDKIPKEWK